MNLRPAAPTGTAPIPVTPGMLIEATCAACRHHGLTVHVERIDGERMWLCDDPAACTNRYRDGATPAAYAAAL